MSHDQNAKPLDHEYDGIQELDNPLPGWWLATFYGAIVFAAFYLVYFHGMSGHSLEQEYQDSLKQLQAAGVSSGSSPNAPQSVGPTNEEMLALLQKTEVLAKGQEIFAGKCLACHGPQGQGLIGPNLTDNFWVNGDGTMTAILKVVKEGVVAKGMLAWETQLKPEELVAVTVFVKSLKGTNPPNPKPAQGTEFPN